jgi:phosphopantetheinyl transferase (holo-ACP synthase)
MSFYIGLSLLSKSALAGKLNTHFVLHSEGRHILHRLDATASSVIKIESKGRPFFEDGHADFSISHSGRLAAVAFTNTIFPKGRALRVGCDVQLIKADKMRSYIARKFYAPEERKYIENTPDKLCRDTIANDYSACRHFHHIWVLKEAFLKAHGLSIAEINKAPAFMFSQNSDLRGVRRSPDKMKITVRTDPFNKSTGLRYFLYESGMVNSECYMMAAAIEETEDFEPPELYWYTQPSLSFNRIAET